MTKYGLAYGTGVATALVAVALMFIGVAAVRLGESPAIRRAAAALALIEIILASVHIARVHVFAEYLNYGPKLGLVAVIAGGAGPTPRERYLPGARCRPF